jgi:hypothetical protein
MCQLTLKGPIPLEIWVSPGTLITSTEMFFMGLKFSISGFEAQASVRI